MSDCIPPASRSSQQKAQHDCRDPGSPLTCTTGSRKPFEPKLGWPVLALFIAASTACHDTSGPQLVVLRIEPTSTVYLPADTVSVALRNLGSVSISFSGCMATLEQRDGADWVVPGPVGNAGINCPDALRGTLAPGATWQGPVGVIPGGTSSGIYRYRMEGIHRDLVSIPLADRLSAPFLVGMP
jgi:hypothetical protein